MSRTRKVTSRALPLRQLNLRKVLIILCASIIAAIAFYNAPIRDTSTPLHHMRSWLQTNFTRFNSALSFRPFAPTQAVHATTSHLRSPQAVMSASTDSPTTTTPSTTSSQQTREPKPLALPPAASGNGKTLNLSDPSSTISLDHLGPMVVNADGTLSRISNWEQMSEIERKNTLRVLGKRNRERLEKLRAAEAEEAGRVEKVAKIGQDV